VPVPSDEGKLDHPGDSDGGASCYASPVIGLLGIGASAPVAGIASPASRKGLIVLHAAFPSIRASSLASSSACLSRLSSSLRQRSLHMVTLLESDGDCDGSGYQTADGDGGRSKKLRAKRIPVHIRHACIPPVRLFARLRQHPTGWG